MINSGIVKLNLDQGSTFDKVVIYKNKETDLPYDLTGYTAKMQIRSSYSASTFICELSTANGKITIDSLLGKLSLKILDTETALIPAGNYVFDLEISSISLQVVRKLLKGSISVYPEVTK